MAKSKKQKELDEELLRECQGYLERDDKPDGAYIQNYGRFFNINKIKRLIEAGANLNAKDNDGQSPLHWAVRGDNIALVEILISAGANVNAKDKWGSSPLHFASSVDIAKLLISAGANVNAKNSDGQSLLHWLSRGWNNVDLAKLLISAGADVNAKDNKKITPLLFSIKNKDTKVIELLIKSGVKIDSNSMVVLSVLLPKIHSILIKNKIEITKK